MVKPRSTEHGLLMSGPMALAAFRGIKTQTRRPLKVPGAEAADLELSTYTADGADFIWRMNPSDESPYVAVKCPYGRAGDRIYVRETWRPETNGTDAGDHYLRVRYACDGFERHISYDDAPSSWIIPKAARRGNVPSLLMPKFVARTWGTITSVRVERAQSIDAAGILAEGAVARGHNDSVLGKCPVSVFDGKCYVDLVSLWAAGWDSLYSGELSWAANPWNWVVQWKKDEVCQPSST